MLHSSLEKNVIEELITTHTSIKEEHEKIDKLWDEILTILSDPFISCENSPQHLTN